MAGNGRVPKWTRCGKYLCLGKDINEEKKRIMAHYEVFAHQFKKDFCS